VSSQFDIPNNLEELFQSLAGTVSGFLGVCIVGPIMEEMIMRRVILKEMAKATKSMWWGIIISSALFAIIHGNPIQIVFAMPAGIFLGWVYCKTGSLLVPICIHIINNTVSFLLMSAGIESNLSLNSTLGMILFISFVLISTVSCIWIVRYYAKIKKEQELQQAAVVEESESDSSTGELVE
jgi:membrane protease YdiL (CAAX protease family)